MMRHLYLLLLFVLFSPSVLSTEQTSTDDELPAYSRLYSPERDPFQDGRDAIALARSTERRIVIELGGEWCVWCKVLDQFLHDNPAIKQQFHRSFVLLKVNVSEENRNQKFRAGLPPTNGFPHFFVSDQSGTVLHSQDNLELLSDGQYSSAKFQGFIQKWGPTLKGKAEL